MMAYGLVHLFSIYPKKQLREVLKNMYAALKSEGWIYTSFKYGEFEGERNWKIFY